LITEEGTMTMTAQERPTRGRPRPAETIRRDDTILSLLQDHPDGLTRNAIAEAMNLNCAGGAWPRRPARKDRTPTKTPCGWPW
jgi:hypothetical protein